MWSPWCSPSCASGLLLVGVHVREVERGTRGLAAAHGYRVRSLALFGVYGVVLMQVLHLQDAFLWLVCYEAATVLLLVTVLTLSAQ